MGIGDELMLAGEARRLVGGGDGKYAMLDKAGRPRWHPAWECTLHVARPGEPCVGSIGWCSGKRPYVADVRLEQYTFREYAPAPAAIKLTARAQSFARQARGAVVFNPMIKTRASPNKDWGIERWRALIALGGNVRWIEVGEHDAPLVGGAVHIRTQNFWDAVGAVSGALAVVTHEGALHHAAAAVGTPAVVIRGGFISPRVTGYAGQEDLYVEDERWPLGCGMRVPCAHCAAAMAAITPALVLQALRRLCDGKVRRVA